MKNNFFDYLYSRQFIHQSTDDEGIKNIFKNKPCVGYIGFDCTSDSLHVGSLLPLMILRHFQRHGHKPIILLGGGTTMIGDPSGKDETRQILNKDTIYENKEKLKKIFEKFVSFDSKKVNCAKIVDNNDWLSNLQLIPFLREIGSKFSVNKMINLESSKLRLEREQNLSFLEFNYSIFQAYDFLELNKKYNCSIQFGGSDQWGNIVSGIELVKKINNTSVFGLTTPLITTSTGQKMGKTNSGAIWLSKEKLNIQDFWQFWRNTSDEDVFKFMLYFTDLEMNEINQIKKSSKDINEVKVLLANEITKLCHSEADAVKANNEANMVLSGKKIEVSIIEDCQKKITVNNLEIQQGFKLKQALINLNLASSNGESKRLISQGAVKINDEIIVNKEQNIKVEMFREINKRLKDKFLIIYVGKKNYGIIKLIN